MKTKIIPLYLSVFLILSCAAVKELIQPPIIDFKSVNLTEFSFNHLTLDFALSIYNPNPVGASLSGYDYSFVIEGNEFLKGDETRSITLASQGSSILHIPVTVRFKELYELFKSIENQDTVSYRLSGHFRPTGILSGFNIPFTKSGSLPAVKTPRLSLSNLKVQGLSLSKVDLELVLKIDNPNFFGIDMSQLDYKINISGQEVASGLAKNLAQVPKKGIGTITLPISFNFSGVASALRSAITGQSVDCVVSGGAELNTQCGSVHLPINLNQNVRILR
ncbi:MAG: LEA type 2 family protein [candidate division KSB1 bacterium]|nr:LEA type 2 family protein [candidate division KSB1 bacterium]